MSSEPLSPDNDYNFPPAPVQAYLDDTVWNGVMTSIGGRLRSLEEVGEGIGAVLEQLQTLGLAILDEAINPLIADTQATIVTLSGQLTGLTQQVIETAAANALILEDFESVVAVNLEEMATTVASLQESIGEVEEAFTVIIGGGIPTAALTGDFDGGTFD